MKIKKNLTLISLMLGVMMLVGAMGMVSATTIFSDNFDGYNTGSSGDTQMQTANWVSNDWGHVEVVSSTYQSSPKSVKIWHDANLSHSVSTLGKKNIVLSYYRKTTSCNDFLRIYWRVGNSGAWNSLESIGTANDWTYKTWTLTGADDKSEIQIRFFYDDGSNGESYIDNVQVTGDAIQTCTPESDSTFCSRLGKTCGSVTANDNCENSRTVNCGTCGTGYTCTDNTCVAQGGCSNTCHINLVTPNANLFYDGSVPIDWTSSGTNCPSTQNVFYGVLAQGNNDCTTISTYDWKTLGTNIQPAFNWDTHLIPEGKYCVKVEGSCCASDIEGPFYVDNIAPTANTSRQVCTCDLKTCSPCEQGCTCSQSCVMSNEYTCNEGDTITLYGQNSIDTGIYPSDHLAYAWSEDSAYGNLLSPTDSNNVQFQCLDGTHDVDVGLTVTDKADNLNTATAHVHILNVIPTCGGITSDVNDVPLLNGKATVKFTGSATDFDADKPLGFAWNFGDTTSANGNPSVTHDYLAEGTYTVTLTVSDKNGGVSSPVCTKQINIIKPKVLGNQEAAAFYPFNFDLSSELTGTDSGCEGYIVPAGMVVNSECKLHWDRGFSGSANPTNDQRRDNTVIIKTTNPSVNYYQIDVRVYSWMIDLQEGWNLISIPLVPETDNPVPETDSSIDNVILNPLNGNLSGEEAPVVYSYQFDGLSNKWLSSTSTGVGNLDTVIPGHGYWIKVSKDSVLKGMGKETAEPTGGLPEVKVLTNSWALIGRYGILGKDWGPSQPLDNRVYGSLDKNTALDSVKIFTDTLHVSTVSNTGNIADASDLYNNEGYWLWVEDNKAHESQAAGYAPIDDYYQYNNML
jgi:hypothetical protein